jgi:hypothetical protein
MRRLVVRFVVSTLVALGAALVVVLLLTVADLYLVGHGHASINRELLVWPAAGVSLSPAGIVLLVSAAGAWCTTWFLMRRID